ncbi:hypothetical protein [Spirosoma sp. 48-14]|uniref:hypothetical protein n=1 Tax=Spirosoma sp. 48-14 TaxID=1895854 RepID=UPI0009622DED|nr:hypothetical protein [Spirosoma sp. 48-14]OJW75699.1 MAG: hypothetical protein BGO59_09030 [Spirosoma sp. 48-14]
MINQLIARYLADALEPLNGPVISRLAGLVKTLETDVFTSGKISRFPIPLEASPASCSLSGRAFPDLVPDQAERLIIYFEEIGSPTSNQSKWTSRLRLIGWGNQELFQDVSAEKATAVLIARIERLFRKIVVDSDSPVQSLRCEVTGSPSSDTNLFSRYTYSQTSSQYLFPPYFAFGLDLVLTFTLHDDCNFELTGLPVAGC